MVISPHADDAAIFCGGTLAKLTDSGWEVVLVRVTDDAKDSVGLTIEKTIEINTEELHRAAGIMGISIVEELGYETDSLADISLVELRERIIYMIRKYRPYAVFSFDPYGLYENNMDHIRVAQAVDEAFWVSCFDLHHPEHFDEGLRPFSVCERWYFGRKLRAANHAEDVTHWMQKKVDAVCAHQMMMRNTIHQSRLQLETWGRRVKWLDDSMEGDMKPLIATVFQAQANEIAEQFRFETGTMAEAYRLVRFGDLEDFFQQMGETIPGALEPPPRKTFDVERQPDLSRSEKLNHVYPEDINKRIRLMGHHHLCIGAYDELARLQVFKEAYPELVSRLKPQPDLLVESIFGYDLFCYQCGWWSEDEGKCETGWKNKITKDAAVLNHLGLKTGRTTRLEDLQKLLAEKVTSSDLRTFCEAGDWKCEFYILGVCQKGYKHLRQKFDTAGQ